MWVLTIFVSVLEVKLTVSYYNLQLYRPRINENRSEKMDPLVTKNVQMLTDHDQSHSFCVFVKCNKMLAISTIISFPSVGH